MAYILGFWFADGYMRHNRSYGITFTSTDKDILEQINQSFQSNAPIVRWQRNGKPEKTYTLIIRSRKLFQDLIKLGGIQRKSLIIQYPKIPKAFMADFIRGYFDGDGSVYFTTYNRTKDHQRQTDFRCNFTSGSSKFLHSLRNLLTKELGLFPRKVCGYGNGNQYKLEYAGKDAVKLLQFMYKNLKAPYLERKFAIYQKYLISWSTQ